MSTLILGYGNPLRGDDGIGWVAAEQLAKKFSDPGICVLARQQLTPELAADAAQVERLVLIDATQDGIAGKVGVEKIAPSESTESAFTHQLKPGELLACAHELYGRAPETWLVSVAGASFECSDKLSAPVAAALPAVLSRVEEIALRIECTS